jgi:hypothetical protein
MQALICARHCNDTGDVACGRGSGRSAERSDFGEHVRHPGKELVGVREGER